MSFLRIRNARPPARALFGPAGPSPADVRQAPWRQDCHLLAAAQAVAAHDPARLAAQFTAVRDGCVFQCYLPGPSEREDRPCSVRVAYADAHRHGPAVGPLWPACIALSFARTRGGVAALYARGEAKNSLRWLLGFPTATLSLGGGPEETAEQLAYLCALHTRGEAIVLHGGGHAVAVVGTDTTSASPRLVGMDPLARSNSRTFTVAPNALGSRWQAVTHSRGAGLRKADAPPEPVEADGGGRLAGATL